jgi:hypothetical protein
MRFTFLFFVVLFTPVILYAQMEDSLKLINDTIKISPNYVKFRQPKIRYKTTLSSIPYLMVRDEGHSPLLHKGSTFRFAKYNERWRKKSVTKLELAFGIGWLRSSKKNNVYSTVNSLIMEVNYYYMVPITKLFKGRGDWYAGGILTNTFDGRLYSFLPNNAFGYEFSNVINPATHITYNFKIGKYVRKYQAGFKLNFALLAHVVRPNYIGMEPAETYMQESINPFAVLTHGNKIALPNRFFRINTEIYLDRFFIKNNDKLRIIYGWGVHVTKLPDSNPLYTAYHSIGVASMLYSEKVGRKGKKKNNKI